MLQVIDYIHYLCVVYIRTPDRAVVAPVTTSLIDAHEQPRNPPTKTAGPAPAVLGDEDPPAHHLPALPVRAIGK